MYRRISLSSSLKGDASQHFITSSKAVINFSEICSTVSNKKSEYTERRVCTERYFIIKRDSIVNICKYDLYFSTRPLTNNTYAFMIHTSSICATVAFTAVAYLKSYFLLSPFHRIKELLHCKSKLLRSTLGVSMVHRGMYGCQRVIVPLPPSYLYG